MGRPAGRIKRLISSAASVNATAAFNGPGILKQILGYNARTSAVFLKLYALKATLAAPAATDEPLMTIYIPASSAFSIPLGDGAAFSFGLGYRLTTGSADNDAGALAAGDILGLNLLVD